MADKGHCKHGEFELDKGCPQCVADRMGKEGNTEVSIAEAIKNARSTDEPEVSLYPETEPVADTALIQVNPQIDNAVIALHEQSVKLEQYAVALVIANDENVKSATNDLSIIKGLKGVIEEKRKEYTQPITDHLKDVNEAFKVFVEPLNQADQITRGKILEYRAEQDRIRIEQEEINRKRREAAEAEMRLKGEITEPVNLVEVLPEQANHYRAEAGTLGTANLWQFEVVDFSLLPDQYKLPDMVKIRKVITAGATIPGVRAWQEETLRVTTKKEE